MVRICAFVRTVVALQWFCDLCLNCVCLITRFTYLPTGRPEKLPDVCYSWWVLASLKIIGRLHWINKVRTAASYTQDTATY